MPTEPAPEQALPAVPHTAPLGRRVAALAIDWGASILVARLAFPQVGYLSEEGPWAVLAIFFAEVTVLTGLTGASFGQRLLGLRVETLEGRRLPLWRAAVRTALICLVIPAVIFDAQGRGLQDRATGSICVRAPQRD